MGREIYKAVKIKIDLKLSKEEYETWGSWGTVKKNWNGVLKEKARTDRSWSESERWIENMVGGRMEKIIRGDEKQNYKGHLGKYQNQQ